MWDLQQTTSQKTQVGERDRLQRFMPTLLHSKLLWNYKEFADCHPLDTAGLHTQTNRYVQANTIQCPVFRLVTTIKVCRHPLSRSVNPEKLIVLLAWSI